MIYKSKKEVKENPRLNYAYGAAAYYYGEETANTQFNIEPQSFRFKWFKFWWNRKHRNWADTRQKKKAMAKEWERRNKR